MNNKSIQHFFLNFLPFGENIRSLISLMINMYLKLLVYVRKIRKCNLFINTQHGKVQHFSNISIR